MFSPTMPRAVVRAPWMPNCEGSSSLSISSGMESRTLILVQFFCDLCETEPGFPRSRDDIRQHFGCMWHVIVHQHDVAALQRPLAKPFVNRVGAFVRAVLR